MYMRIANTHDISKISEIHATCWQEVYHFMPESVLRNRSLIHRQNQWKNWFEDPDGGLFVAIEDGSIVGFCYCLLNKDPSIDADGEMRAGYMIPSARGGASCALLMHVMGEFLLSEGAKSCVLWAFAANRFRSYYHHIGWRPTIHRDRMLDGHSIAEVGYIWQDMETLIPRLDEIIDASQRRPRRVSSAAAKSMMPSLSAGSASPPS